MSRKTETRVESKLEYKNDHSNAENQATSQIKNVVNDINKVVENMNKLTNNNKLMNSESCNSESTNGQSDDGKRTEKNESSKSKDEIPLIDDGVEESKQTRPNCDEMQNDNQMHQHHSSIDQTTHTECALQSNSFTPSYAPYDTQLSNSSTHPQSNQAVGGLDQAMSTFENIKLTEDESIESVQTTDLCQCKLSNQVIYRVNNRASTIWSLYALYVLKS